jgi:hypothetical protein
VVRSDLSSKEFHVFLSVLERSATQVTNENVDGLSALSEEFQFWNLLRLARALTETSTHRCVAPTVERALAAVSNAGDVTHKDPRLAVAAAKGGGIAAGRGHEQCQIESKGFSFQIDESGQRRLSDVCLERPFSMKTISEWSEQILAVFPKLFLLPENPRSKSEHVPFEIRY